MSRTSSDLTTMVMVMESQDAVTLPIINISDDETTSWTAACIEVRKALEQYGCFEVVYSKIPSEFMNSVYPKLEEELFELPTETKMKNKFPDMPLWGYSGGRHTNLPIFEGLGIQDAINLEEAQSFTNLMWDDGNPQFCEKIHSYAQLLSELDKMVTKIIFESYGLGQYHDSHIESSTYLLRLLKYRSPETGENDLGLHPHSDKSFTTIVHQNQINGLEIETKDGNWFRYQPSSPSAFLIMAGEALRAWTNHRIYCATHRVMMTGAKKPRYSTIMFSFSKGTVYPPEELVDDQHPQRFRPFDHLEFIRYLSSDEGKDIRRKPWALEAYCGV